MRTVKGRQYLYYFCHQRYPRRFEGHSPPIPCTLPWIHAEPVDAQVWQLVSDILRDAAKDWTALTASLAITASETDSPTRWQEEQARIDRARQRIIGLIAKDLITEAEAEQELRRLRQAEHEVQLQRQQQMARRQTWEERLMTVRSVIEGQDLDHIPFEAKVAVVRELLHQITLDVDADGQIQIQVTFRS